MFMERIFVISAMLTLPIVGGVALGALCGRMAARTQLRSELVGVGALFLPATLAVVAIGALYVLARLRAGEPLLDLFFESARHQAADALLQTTYLALLVLAGVPALLAALEAADSSREKSAADTRSALTTKSRY